MNKIIELVNNIDDQILEPQFLVKIAIATWITITILAIILLTVWIIKEIFD